MGGLDFFSYEGHVVVDRTGHKLGRLERIHRDAWANEPQWAAVKLDVPSHEQTLVPLLGASPEGDDLRLAFEMETVIKAPMGDAAELHRYYGGGPEPLGPPRDWP